MREGRFAVYKGKEYRASISPDLNDKDIVILITDDISEISNGFTKGLFGITKKVKINKLDTAYNIKNYAIFNGYKLQVSDEKAGRLLLTTNDWEVSKKLKMEQTDHYAFHKWVSKYEIEKMWEQKEPLWGFIP